MVSTKAFIFYMSVPCDKTFLWILRIVDPVILTLVCDLLIENFDLGYIFGMVETRALIFHMTVPCDKTFPWVTPKS
jgi:hypothetical protein